MNDETITNLKTFVKITKIKIIRTNKVLPTKKHITFHWRLFLYIEPFFSEQNLLFLHSQHSLSLKHRWHVPKPELV